METETNKLTQIQTNIRTHRPAYPQKTKTGHGNFGWKIAMLAK